MDFITQHCIRSEHKEDSARLYAIAFKSKFLRILGGPDKIAELLMDGLNTQRGISAISADGELLGVLGFHLDNKSLVDITFKSMVAHYGLIKGAIASVVLAILFYRKSANRSQLLMDGIAVKEGNRGRGIGKQLFLELERFAHARGMTSIRLDVIDENPKAKSLYESIGFVSTRYSKTPKLVYKLIGVSGVTTMVKEL
jgi:GNAT superfamily N-acetyltransferase